MWLCSDSMAKDDLKLSAELFHLMFHESPHQPADWSSGVTLRVYETIAAKSPHGGLPVEARARHGASTRCARVLGVGRRMARARTTVVRPCREAVHSTPPCRPGCCSGR